ncbi:glutamate--glyoxylate aminotransferase 2-like [Tripterygium wilfordii]|uniref:glutamate--glyoxylate aminotransferase 2-like n=1 Tax=Tripterygium wilfordii TaxID=458696 RepID=UPI0018F80961|nr:glutamate--glyoxylate aminotransferase 2-like [Tripterygium wilfordii]
MMTDGFNSCRNVVCNFTEGAMYSFPQMRLPPKAIEAAKKARKVPDVFYCLKLVEATGISTVPGSGFGQKEGVFHLRTTILPAEEDMPAIMSSFKKFNDEFMEQYEESRGYSRM